MGRNVHVMGVAWVCVSPRVTDRLQVKLTRRQLRHPAPALHFHAASAPAERTFIPHLAHDIQHAGSKQGAFSLFVLLLNSHRSDSSHNLATKFRNIRRRIEPA
jgi:hypothetical protein